MALAPEPEILLEGRPLYSVKAAASILGISPRRVYRLVESSYIPHLRMGGRILLDLQEVAVELRSGESKPRPEKVRKAQRATNRASRKTLSGLASRR